eukprot:NODE_176_length_2814_cov_25.279122_g162_i0.p1 GENE.NODE_176_length_2814_cov_25.279122_g162_i0~~NODE_176_length_2814_cov_25.279122_g162_i0.p1  ORF type:complete len:841 (+),score=247.34 NODE_176_length_2814_cov_25.279122_g162_i0:201-2723(+)
MSKLDPHPGANQPQEIPRPTVNSLLSEPLTPTSENPLSEDRVMDEVTPFNSTSESDPKSEQPLSEDLLPLPQTSSLVPSPSEGLLEPPSHSNRKNSSMSDKVFRETHTLNRGTDEDGNKTINEYVVVADLGRGAYAKVKLALHVTDDRPFAIKIMNKSLLKKINTGGNSALANANAEIAIMKKLDHPNVTKLFEVIDDPEADKLYLVLEYVEQGAIMKVSESGFADRPAFSFPKQKDYVHQLALGLDYLHTNGIVHRDIKPENILLGSDDVVKFTDFGVSGTFESDDFLEAGGTPAFMSPESCLGNGKVMGKPADMWALGVTVYCMVFAILPFRGSSVQEISKNIQEVTPDFGNTDPLMSDLLNALLQKNPTERLNVVGLLSHSLFADSESRTPIPLPVWAKVEVSDAERENAIKVGRNIKLVEQFAVLAKLKLKFSKKRDDIFVNAPSQSSMSTSESVNSPKRDHSHLFADSAEQAYSRKNSMESDSDDEAPPQPSSRLLRTGFPTEAEIVGEEKDAEGLVRQANSTQSEKLDLDFVKLVELPTKVFTCTFLTTITAIKNELTTIPEELGNLRHLTDLSFASNRIAALPATFGNLTALMNLDLSHNCLTSIPSTATSLQSLVRATLDFNFFPQLPEAFLSIPGLANLFIVCNPVAALPLAADLSNFKHLLLMLDNRPVLVDQWKEVQLDNVEIQWNKVYPDKVLPFIFLGSLRTAQSDQIFDDLNISHVVTCGRELITNVGDRRHLELDLDDTVTVDIHRFFAKAHVFIDEGVASGCNVLVHCFAGISRSATLVISYLMKKQQIPFEEAFAFVKERRPNIQPNEGFMAQLKAYGDELGL